MSPKTGVIVQARMGSTRYPRKMVVPFDRDKGIFFFLMERLAGGLTDIPIVAALPDTPENNVLEKIATELGIQSFRGSENNVLRRFTGAAEEFGITHIIRICADNPFIDIADLKVLAEKLAKSDADYLCYALKDGRPSIQTHYGFWGEGVKCNALKKVEQATGDAVYREHVTNYIYTHPETFEIERLPINDFVEARDWVRCTVDTEVDFQNASTLLKMAREKKITLRSEPLIRLIESQPEMVERMRAEIAGNTK